MSFGGPANSSEDSAVFMMLKLGSMWLQRPATATRVDAGNISPARSDFCTTVGASTIRDSRWSDSNYGAVLDVFAPGENILTASKDSTLETQWANGTSFAAPHARSLSLPGIVAFFISQLGNGKRPAEMIVFVRDTAVRNVLTGIPFGTPNDLANNGNP
ncbi:hypothetical protein CERSUDRAFT_92494 [Gelatoporia subvermispora B]|uniref:Peptidase S8/S53 domain-containing protein n=1 Tax=Ceriporiopsis subvermispora (strain B) TaxID=914234 RepID=M2QSJ9_CERS8|nr:hypothetical protein CERSUDRAFT_92494 [Gelatoporia subvermispora B]